MPEVLVPIADGSEEMEAVIIIDVLRRAKARVVVASVGEKLEIVASRNVKLVADTHLDEAAKSSYDVVVLPGGLGGAQAFAASEKLVELLKKQSESNKPYGAICASPALVLEPHGLLKVEKFMSQWNCNKAFWDRILPSLDYMQLSRDGRMRNFDEKERKKQQEKNAAEAALRAQKEAEKKLKERKKGAPALQAADELKPTEKSDADEPQELEEAVISPTLPKAKATLQYFHKIYPKKEESDKYWLWGYI